MSQNPNTSAYSIDFYLYKLRKAHKEFLRCQQKKREFEGKHVCKKSPYIIHDFQPYQPFPGCFKYVCKFCLQESTTKNLQPSVYSFKGRSFAFPAKKKLEAPRRYEC